MADRRVLVLALGNDLMADDGAALLVARNLEGELPPEVVVREAGEVGMALLEELAGFEAALILDTVQTGKAPPGTVHRFTLDQLSPVLAPSPHWAGLPEVRTWAEAMELPFPRHVVVLAVEASDLLTVGGRLSPEVGASLDGWAARAREEVASLLQQGDF